MLNILEINDFEGPVGGAERHFTMLCDLLREQGNRVKCLYPMEIYCREGRSGVSKSLEGVLAAERFDVAHLHAVDHKFAFIVGELARRKITIAQTLHDHRGICLNGVMVSKNTICERCRPNRHYWAALRGCVNIPMALGTYWSRGILGKNPWAAVDLFISPSAFLISKFREWGSGGTMVHLRNFLEMGSYEPQFEKQENSIVYFGRLSPIKGVETLLNAVKGLPVTVKIIGSGEAEERLRSVAAREKLDNVRLMGRMEGRELHGEVGRSLFAIAPSECYENSPFAVMEAFALGKPVVGSSLGGIPELIGNNERGLVFPAGDARRLRDGIEDLLGSRQKIESLGRAARAYAEEHFDKQGYYRSLARYMEEACSGKSEGEGR
jgi:glycosyltransferase involved in cell wall biosynthesis